MRSTRTCLIAVAVVLAGCSGKAPAPSPSTPRPTATPTATPAPISNVYEHVTPDHLSRAVAGVKPRVYVPNSDSNTVDVIDPVSMEIVDHFEVGVLPQHVTPSWDLKHLWVGNNRSNSLTEIDPRTGKKGRSVLVDAPYNLYFTPDGTKAIVVAERLRRLDFRDPKTWKLIKFVRIPYQGPNHLDFSPDGRYLIVSCEFAGWVVKVDVEKMRVLDAVKIGGKPADVRVSPSGSVFFVANEFRGGVSVLDPKAMKEIAFIPTGAGAHGFVVSRSGRSLYVTNRRAGSVSVLDFASRKVARTWYTGGSPDMGGVSADGNRLWLSGRYDATVYVIDTTRGRVIRRIPVGFGPHGVCVFPQPGRFSLGHTGNFR